jgi:hypothetical protein
MPEELPMNGWYAEKCIQLVRAIARSLATLPHVADEDVREALHADLHGALGLAMKIAAEVNQDPALWSIARVDAISKNPEASADWMRDLVGEAEHLAVVFSNDEKRSLSESVAKQLDGLRRWRAGERPEHLREAPDPEQGT